jgi:hypothetical protein
LSARLSRLGEISTMSISRKFRTGLAVSAVLASCQLVGCGSDIVDPGAASDSGGSNAAGNAGSAQAGKAGANGRAGSGHAGDDAEGGMAGEAELGGGSQAGGNSGGSAGTVGGAAGLGNAGKGGASGASGASAGGTSGGGVGGLASGGKGGAGGAVIGTGGSSAGAGAGGASAGTGGASAGSGGASGAPTCGNNVLDSGEVCDPKLSANNCGRDCKAITTATCLACENSASYVCSPSILTCDTATGGTTTATVTGSSGGAKATDPGAVTTPVGSPKAPLCNEVLDCVRDSGCAADGQPALRSCYCGSATGPNCNAGLGNGPCKAELERALEATDFATISQNVGKLLYGGGVAMKRIDCDNSFCPDTCF